MGPLALDCHDSRIYPTGMTMFGTMPVGISYSGGKSSKWLLHAMINGVLPRPVYVAVFFAHTGIEHEWTYEDVEDVRETCRKAGVEFIQTQRDQPLDEHLLAIGPTGATRAETPPLYVLKDGGGRGQIAHRCTREFKVAPMRRAQSAWLKRIGQPKRIEKWVGFASDEVGRAVKANAKRDVAWERLAFPAIYHRRHREQQHADLVSWGAKVPRFSMCTICPWKTPGRWHDTPEAQRARVIEVDESIRDLTACGVTDGDAYLTDQLIPVSALFKRGRPAQDATRADAGCDGGHCFL